MRCPPPLAAVLPIVLLVGCSGAPSTITPAPSAAGSGDTATEAPVAAVPDTYREGGRQFTQYCSECHGPAATGTDKGPPLVHVVYEPGHHSDQAFVAAAMLGAPSHHWQFGDMPPVEGVTEDQVAAITEYVRHLQRQAGIQ